MRFRMVRFALKFFSVLLLLSLAGEIAGRAYGSIFISRDLAWRWMNFAEIENIDVIKGKRYPAQKHPILGYVPSLGHHLFWGDKSLTIRSDFTRSNGVAKPLKESAIVLAVGDSFTFGDQVHDWESWPAYLSRLLGVNVVNGGMVGYGLGQIYLRAKMWLKKNNADALIVGIIPDDIDRTGLIARTGIPKPTYFIENDRLILRTAEQNAEDIQNPAKKSIENLIKPFRAIFGYSFFLHQILLRAFPESWRSNRYYIRGHNQGQEVSCRLFKKFAAFGIHRKVLFIQYPAQYVLIGRRPEAVSVVIGCAKRAGFYIVDSFEPLRALYKVNKARFLSLYVGHMSAKGNDFSAQLLSNAPPLNDL